MLEKNYPQNYLYSPFQLQKSALRNRVDRAPRKRVAFAESDIKERKKERRVAHIHQHRTIPWNPRPPLPEENEYTAVDTEPWYP